MDTVQYAIAVRVAPILACMYIGNDNSLWNVKALATTDYLDHLMARGLGFVWL